MGFKLKNIVLPSGMNKKTVVIALTTVGIIMGGIFYFITNDDAMPTNANGEKEKVVINDDANSSTITKIIGTKSDAPPVESGTTTNANASAPIILVNGINKLNSSTPTPTEYDIAAKKMEQQAKIKRLQTSFDALNSKSSMGGGAKANASQAVGGAALVSNNSAQSNESAGSGGKNVAVSDAELLAPKSPYMLQATSIIPAASISAHGLPASKIRQPMATPKSIFMSVTPPKSLRGPTSMLAFSIMPIPTAMP